MRLGKLKITNFASIRGSNVIDFTKAQDKKILITGECHVAEGVDSNGSGKSSVFDAISWVLFGKTPKDLEYVDEVVNDFESNCSVQLELLRDKDSIVVLRTRAKGKDTELEFWVGDDHRKNRITSQTQEQLLTELGIASDNKDYFNDFLNSTYISTETVDILASKSMANKESINLIARFLNLEAVEKAYESAKDQSDTLKDMADKSTVKVNDIQAAILNIPSAEECNSNVANRELSIRVTKALIETDKEELDRASKLMQLEIDLVSLQSRISLLDEKYKNQVTNLEAQVESLKKEKVVAEETKVHIDELKAEVTRRKTAGVGIPAELIKTLQDCENQINNARVTDRQYERGIEALKDQLLHAITCPQCGSRLSVSNNEVKKFDVKDIEFEIGAFGRTRESLAINIKDLSTKIDSSRLELDIHRGAVLELQSLERELGLAMSRGNLRSPAEIDTSIELSNNTIRSLYTNYDTARAGLVQEHDSIAKRLVEEKTRSMAEINAEIEGYYEIIQQHESAVGYYRTSEANRVEKEKELEKEKVNQKQLNDTLAGVTFWVRGFSEIKRITIEDFLPELQAYTNHLLSLIESGISIQLSTVRSRKKGGDPIERFSILVCSSEGKIRSFKTYSQGEKRRIASCMALALKHLSQSKGYQPFEFTLFDEVIDGLDSTGTDEFFKLLDYVPGLDLVISHSSELNSRFNSHINVVRKQESTEIVQ